MNIEQPVRTPTEEEVRGVEERVNAFIAEHQDIAEMDFSEKETRRAAELMTGRLASSGKSVEDLDEDMMRRALEARRDVRGSEKMPVFDNQGVVLGTVSSQEKAKKLVQRENEARDLN